MTLLAMLAAGAVLAPVQSLKSVNIAPGRGPGAQVGDMLSMEYKGTLTNGKVFDQNVGKDPFRFMLGAGMVIKGWDQGLVGMKEGGRRRLTIPANLAYGSQANGDIPANSTLVFEVRLIKIERAKVETLRAGSGPGAKFGDSLMVHYKGMLADGKQFDSSYDRGQPFPVDLPGQVIPGFTQGLLGIKKGERRKVTIPPTLGYGARGAGGVIPPNATLVFELEAVSITPGRPR